MADSPSFPPALQVIERETGPAPERSVLWLHGLGADGHDFEPVVPHLGLPASMPVRFVFPHAPVRPVTINGGMPMRAWYDILQMGGGAQDAVGIRTSQRQIEALIEREVQRGVPQQRIVLAGFSQGGAIALHTGLRHAHRLAGLLALSTYLPLSDTLEAERSQANAGLPILMIHGVQDAMIALGRAHESRAALAALGYAVRWRDYPMGHEVCVEELTEIGAWLREVLA